MNCQSVRTEIHCEPQSVQAHLSACPGCASYAERFARLDGVLRVALRQQAPAELSLAVQALPSAPGSPARLDAAVRAELVVQAPPALTQRLLALIPRPHPLRTPMDFALRDQLILQAPAELTARLAALAAGQPLPQSLSLPVHRPRRWVVSTVYAVTAVLLFMSLMFAGQLYGAIAAQLGIEQLLAQIAGLPAQALDWLYTVVPQSRVVISAIVELQQPLQWLLLALVLWAVFDITQRQGRSSAQAAQRA